MQERPRPNNSNIEHQIREPIYGSAAVLNFGLMIANIVHDNGRGAMAATLAGVTIWGLHKLHNHCNPIPMNED